MKTILISELRKLALGIAIVAGTFIGNNESVSPFYNNKTKTSVGINIGAYNTYSPGSKFYGINLSVVSNHDSTSEFYGLDLAMYSENKGTISGAQINIGNESSGTTNGVRMGIVGNNSRFSDVNTVNGLEAGLLNLANAGRYSTVNGIQLGIVNLSKHDHAVQLGLVNYSNCGKGLQLGILNALTRPDSTQNMQLGLNYNFE
jgi:hypothetical protein